MDQEFLVIKFGDKYYSQMNETDRGVVLTLTEYLNSAKRFEADSDNKKFFKKILALGGSIVEVNIREFNRTYEIKRELEEAEDK